MAGQTNAGDLNSELAFDKRELVDDGYGNAVGGFVEQFRCRASLIPLRGGETVMGARLEGRQPVAVRVRRSSVTLAVSPDWRARDLQLGTEYAVRSAYPTPDRKWVDIVVESGIAA